MAKIIGIVGGCRGCPNRRYYSGGKYECSVVDQLLADDVSLPSWCPLPDHPAHAIGGAQVAISTGRTVLETALKEVEQGASTARVQELLRLAIERFPQAPM